MKINKVLPFLALILNRASLLDMTVHNQFTYEDTKYHKIDGVLKVFQTKKCRQAIIIIEFSHRQYASTDNNTSPSYPESSCPGLSGSPLI
ncbi:hypothetical protein RhiirC2_787498 [Rhizophagus irregularis]|uniref:Secreted protein n=1 Tax=Rhizophagus irregularis TaxID=588596 RepID=A0A2N1MS40_9GLOM|nr:hypothetical protein RhiirC2_787498 [Rhizophagus irregularis]